MGDDEAFSAEAAPLDRLVRMLKEALREPRVPRPSELPLSLPDHLPEEGTGGEAALQQIADAFVRGASLLSHPGYFAHMDPPTPWLTWAAHFWMAALNQNMLHPDTSPSAVPLEEAVLRWITPLFGMNGGHLTSGSTLANLTALWAARELRAINEVVASSASHISIKKAAQILGLRYRSVPVDAAQRIVLEEVGDLSSAALVLTAGTVSTGSLDPLQTEVPAAWRHVDAAWAGPLRFSERHAALLEGIQVADSVSVSAHKWLFQPKECALIMFRDVYSAHAATSFGDGYLARPNIGLLGSRAATAVPLAATLLAWGRSGVGDRLNRCMELSHELADFIRCRKELELWSQPETGVVVWRPRHSSAVDVQARLGGAFVSLTHLDGRPWLRSVAANPMAEPALVVDQVLNALG